MINKLTSFNFTVTDSVQRLSDYKCSFVKIMNNTHNTSLYIGGSNLDSSNGYGALSQFDTLQIDCSNLDCVYLKAGTGENIRVSILVGE